MSIEQYLNNINKKYKINNTSEEAFRSDLQQLIESLLPEIRATSEPRRQACGAPDYILMKDDIPIGFIEALDLGSKDLEGDLKTSNIERLDRYKESLNNILLTNYLEFYLFREGQLVNQIAIGEIHNGTVVPLPDNFTAFTYLLRDFSAHIGQTINSSRTLAELMARKTQLLSGVIEKAIINDDINQESSTLKDQQQAFRQYLYPDSTPEYFAHVYAQTIAYGMFAARLHDPSLPSFSRQEAAELIPRSNPFLHKLFNYIAGPDIDDRIKWIVDNLTEVFLACNVKELLQNFGKATKTEDPIVHFYETFLSEYDTNLPKAKGIWYTPQSVVNFIVRSIDDILKTEFNLLLGLADSSKTNFQKTAETTFIADQFNEVKQNLNEQNVHQVQLLDLATGAGSFLAGVVRYIHKGFETQEGAWSNYVETNLLPRLNGFEKQMATHTMAHLKLDYFLTETGYKPAQNQRLKIYLADILAEDKPDSGTSYTNWFSTEAEAANQVKSNSPIMCVLGNLPFSTESVKTGEEIDSLLEDYKKGLNNNEIDLGDEYIKFIRYGQHLIHKNGNGILAFVSNNNFIDDITHRQMRKHLLESFDKICILDLHGNVKKKETAADGSPDQNIFDVIQGVSINIFIKTGQKKADELGKVYYSDLYGNREFKYNFLDQNALKTINFQEVRPKAPLYFLVQKSYGRKEIYNQGFKLNDLFLLNNAGVISKNHAFVIGEEGHSLVDKIKDFFKVSSGETQKKYLLEENGGWKIIESKQPANELKENALIKVSYRPFDEKHVYYEKAIASNNTETKKLFSRESNINLILSKRSSAENYSHLFITDNLVFDSFLSDKPKEKGYAFPLYLYSETNGQLSTEQIANRKPNLDPAVVNQIAENLGLIFTPEKETEGEVCFANSPEVRPEFKQSFAPADVLDYVYAVLHSPTYREKYKEFLKIDFPRVPYPKDVNSFWQLVKLGGELRQIHLLQSPVNEQNLEQYPVKGSNVVNKIKYQAGHVYINNTQYFSNVPSAVWDLYIGGYQPAQKWLKARKGQTLSFEDILHYQKIILALTGTVRIMTEISEIALEEPTVDLVAE